MNHTARAWERLLDRARAGLVDLALTGALVMIVIFSGYENFVVSSVLLALSDRASGDIKSRSQAPPSGGDTPA